MSNDKKDMPAMPEEIVCEKEKAIGCSNCDMLGQCPTKTHNKMRQDMLDWIKTVVDNMGLSEDEIYEKSLEYFQDSVNPYHVKKVAIILHKLQTAKIKKVLEKVK